MDCEQLDRLRAVAARLETNGEALRRATEEAASWQAEHLALHHKSNEVAFDLLYGTTSDRELRERVTEWVGREIAATATVELAARPATLQVDDR